MEDEDEFEDEDFDEEADLEESAPPTIPPEMREWAEQEYGEKLAEDDINVMLDEEKENKDIPVWVIVLLSVLSGLILIVLVILLQQKYVYGKREKAFHHADRNHRIIYAYLMIERLLGQRGGKEEKPLFEKETAEMEGFAIKAYFSGKEMSEEEWKKVLALYEKIRKGCYARAGLKKKISYRFRGF